jgi:Uma2 family endonuclease
MVDQDDPFRLGWRTEWVRLPDGTFQDREVPLTEDDLLDPQIGDHMVQGTFHIELVTALFRQLKLHFQPLADVLVSSDLKILWGIPRLPNPAPDVAVFQGVRDKSQPRDSFDVVEEGVGPSLVVEVVSTTRPEYWTADHVEKVEIYRRAGVPEYVLIDPPTSPTSGRFRLTGFRLDSRGRYREIRKEGGRLRCETVGIAFAISLDRRSLLVFDTKTGTRIPTWEDERAAKEAAEAEVAKLRAELDRLKGR